MRAAARWQGVMPPGREALSQHAAHQRLVATLTTFHRRQECLWPSFDTTFVEGTGNATQHGNAEKCCSTAHWMRAGKANSLIKSCNRKRTSQQFTMVDRIGKLLHLENRKLYICVSPQPVCAAFSEIRDGAATSIDYCKMVQCTVQNRRGVWSGYWVG